MNTETTQKQTNFSSTQAPRTVSQRRANIIIIEDSTLGHESTIKQDTASRLKNYSPIFASEKSAVGQTSVKTGCSSTATETSKDKKDGQVREQLIQAMGAESHTTDSMSDASSSGIIRREERGSSFCDIISSSKCSSSSRGGSHSSLILEDDGSSSDAGISSNDEYRATHSLNHSSDDNDCSDDDDLEQKIKFFFQRIEEQEFVGQPSTVPSATIEVVDVDSSDVHQKLNDDSIFINSTTSE